MTRLTNFDFSTSGGVFSLRVVLLSAGEPVVCREGHWICDVVQDVVVGGPLSPDCFANWQKPGYQPENGGRAPVCHVCGADPWQTPDGALRPWGKLGYRVFPDESGYVAGAPDVQYSKG